MPCLAFYTNRTLNSKEPSLPREFFLVCLTLSLKLYFAGVGLHARFSLNGKPFKQFADSASKGSFNKPGLS